MFRWLDGGEDDGRIERLLMLDGEAAATPEDTPREEGTPLPEETPIPEVDPTTVTTPKPAVHEETGKKNLHLYQPLDTKLFIS